MNSGDQRADAVGEEVLVRSPVAASTSAAGSGYPPNTKKRVFSIGADPIQYGPAQAARALAMAS